jgi:hypothetical protein
MDELSQIINKIIMKLDNNEKIKIMENVHKKELVEKLIYSLLKDYEKDYEDEQKNILDNEEHILLLSSMYH